VKIFGKRKWKSYEEEQLIKLDETTTKEEVLDKKKEKLASEKKETAEKDNGKKLD